MYIVKAEANQVEKIVDMSVRAFETDVYVGGVKGDCPPEFDSVEWHKQMAREGHLYQAMIGKDLVGAAIAQGAGFRGLRRHIAIPCAPFGSAPWGVMLSRGKIK
jgi:hypothetical protein